MSGNYQLCQGRDVRKMHNNTNSVKKKNTAWTLALNLKVSDILNFCLSRCPFKAPLHVIIKMIPPNRIRGATQKNYHFADFTEALIHDDWEY